MPYRFVLTRNHLTRTWPQCLMFNEVMVTLVNSISSLPEAAGTAEQTNSKSNTLVLSIRFVLRLAGIQIQYKISFFFRRRIKYTFTSQSTINTHTIYSQYKSSKYKSISRGSCLNESQTTNIIKTALPLIRKSYDRVF